MADDGPQERLVRAGRARLYVREVGHGPAIVVLHGGPDFDHAYLLPELDQWSTSFRLIYYDQRGRGRSSYGVRAEDVTIETEVDDLDAILQELELPSVCVLGHSWGGVLAMEYAIRRPDRVSHLILMNTAPASASDARVLRRALAASRTPDQRDAMAAIASSDAYIAGDREADAAYYRIHFATAFAQPEWVEDIVGRLRANVTEDGIVLARQIEDRLYDQTWSDPDYDLLPQLRALRVPALILHGDCDFCPLAAVRPIADAIPGSRLTVLEDCGHFAYVEQPERTRACVAEFLAAQ
jgi:proline-specific peptidase